MAKKTTVTIGKPGAGKGTRLNKFLEKNHENFEVISVSNLLRKAKRDQGETGKEIESYMNSGKLVPDEIINKIVIDAINSSEKNVLLDGYPRTVVQAKAMLDSGIIPNKVIHFYVDDELVFFRAKTRIVCSSCGETYTTHDFKPPKVAGICDICNGTLVRRKDDQEDVVKNRIETYNAETHPVLSFFESKNIPIYTIDNSEPNSAQQKFNEIMV